MNCAHCRKPITGADTKNPKKVVKDYNEKGQLTGMRHIRCVNHERKMANPIRVKRMAVAPDAYKMTQGQGRQNRDDLTPEALAARAAQGEAYEALRKRQAEIAEQRELEPSPSEFTDWRDPVTLDLEDVVAESQGEPPTRPREMMDCSPECDEQHTREPGCVLAE